MCDVSHLAAPGQRFSQWIRSWAVEAETRDILTGLPWAEDALQKQVGLVSTASRTMSRSNCVHALANVKCLKHPTYL